MAETATKTDDRESARCGDCGNAIGHATRHLHGECFPEHRRVGLKAADPLRCTIVEKGERCHRPKVSHDWCGTHRQRWARWGHPLADRSAVGKWKMCHFCPDNLPREYRRAVGKDDDGRALCRKHYSRWQRHGDATAVTRRSFEYTGDMETDFWKLVDTKGGDVDECWPWLGTVSVHGYGVFQHAVAHRIAYQLIRGPIPEGKLIDHTCHDPRTCAGGEDCPHRRCVNPFHGEAVTHVENVAPHRSSNGRPVDDGCAIDGCDKRYVAEIGGKLACAGHYQRFRKHDDFFEDVPLRKAGGGPLRRKTA